MFTTLMIPGATEEQMRWLDELQRMAVTADTAMLGPSAARARRRDRRPATGSTMPTLILHSVGDRMNDFDAPATSPSHIPDARLVPLESKNHIVLDDEPAWGVFVDEVTRFMAADGAPVAEPGSARRLLSPRELEVLRLAAEASTTTPSRRR